MAKKQTSIKKSNPSKAISKEIRPSIIGWMKGTVIYEGDILTPINESWNARNK